MENSLGLRGIQSGRLGYLCQLLLGHSNLEGDLLLSGRWNTTSILLGGGIRSSSGVESLIIEDLRLGELVSFLFGGNTNIVVRVQLVIKQGARIIVGGHKLLGNADALDLVVER
jgi:hypothetical protein